MVWFGIDLDSDVRKKLAALDDSLTEDFVVLTEGEKPALGVSIFMFGGGLALGIWLVRGFGSKQTQSNSIPTPPVATPPSPTA